MRDPTIRDLLAKRASDAFRPLLRSVTPSSDGALKERDFRVLLLASWLFSLTGALGSVVHPWIALQLTGSPTWVGLLIGLPP